jgi:hypothetical protein
MPDIGCGVCGDPVADPLEVIVVVKQAIAPQLYPHLEELGF